jgi:hypothetical protein
MIDSDIAISTRAVDSQLFEEGVFQVPEVFGFTAAPRVRFKHFEIWLEGVKPFRPS